MLERTLLQTDYIEERCAPKVNSKKPAVDQGITTTPTKIHEAIFMVEHPLT